jgi:hypothetical protein
MPTHSNTGWQQSKHRRSDGELTHDKTLDSWAAWLVVLKAVFGLPMTPEEPIVFSRHTGRESPPLGGYKLKMTECAELRRIALMKHTTPVSRIISIAVKISSAKCREFGCS